MLKMLRLSCIYLLTEPQEVIKPDVATQSELTLTCPVAKDGFAIFYRKNSKRNKDEELQFSDRYNFPTFSSVVILKLSLEDAGVYNCRNPLNNEVLKTFIIKPFGKSVQDER